MSTVSKTTRTRSSAPKGDGDARRRGIGHAATDVRPEGGTLTRQDLAMAIYDRCKGISRREAKRLIDSVIEEMVSTLVGGESLKLHDFGAFLVRDKHERAGRNPRTGAPVSIEARRVVVFRAAPNMKAAVNGDAPARRRKRAPRARCAAAEVAGTLLD